MSRDDFDKNVQNIQAICHVPAYRAQELLEAASGSIERAMEIHFASSSTVATTQAPLDRKSATPSTPAKSSTSNRSASSSHEKKRQRQGTLHNFLGLQPPPKKKKNPQKRIDDFFVGSKTAVTVDDEHAEKKVLVEDTATTLEPNDSTKAVTIQHGDSSDETTSVALTLTAQHATVVKSEASLSDSPTPTTTSTRTNRLSPRKQQSACSDHDVPYQWLAETLGEMCATTKRTAKLQALQTLFARILQHLGGIADSSASSSSSASLLLERERHVYLFTCTLDLILGKISTTKEQTTSNSTLNAAPLQVSGSAVSTAVQTVTGASRQQLRKAYGTLGDFGDCAAKYFQPRSAVQRFFVAHHDSSTTSTNLHSTTTKLTVIWVHETLQKIANVAPGKGSHKVRQDVMVKLLRASGDKNEVRFLVRTLLGNMRLGATIKSIVAAFATAFEQAAQSTVPEYTALDDPAKCLQEVFHLCPRWDRIFSALLIGGIPRAMQDCSVEVGYPVQPMLANPAHSLDEVRRFLLASETDKRTATADNQHCCYHQAIAEWKYDGVRCQAHWDGKTVKLFSRNLLENTIQYPDAVEYLKQAMKASVTSFILDSELVGVAPSKECRDGYRLLPFQDLSTRRGVKQQEKEKDRIQIRLYVFDLLYLNGESLIQLPLWKRQELLRQSFDCTDGVGFATFVPLPREYDPSFLETTLQESVRDGAEGLMIKLTGNVSSQMETSSMALKHHGSGNSKVASIPRLFGYESGTRSQLWLKLKRDYVSGYGDTTIDVVPIGAWYGSGRKAQKGFLSPVLLAVYDDDEGVYYSISRCMSFTDAMYDAVREFYFHGTPYPPGVGMGEPEEGGDKNNTKAQLHEENVEEEDGNGQNDLSDEDETDLPRRTLGVSSPSLGVVEDDSPLCDEDVNDESEEPKNRVHCLTTRPSWIVTNETPPIWFHPMEVFQVSFADLSLSRSHTAASNYLNGDHADGRGIALRFPRFQRRRPDKAVEQATTTAEIARLYSQQSKIQST